MTRKNEGRNKYFEIGVVHAKGNFMEVWSNTSGMIYLLKDPRDPLLHIHLFESESIDEVGRNLSSLCHDLTQQNEIHSRRKC